MDINHKKVSSWALGQAADHRDWCLVFLPIDRADTGILPLDFFIYIFVFNSSYLARDQGLYTLSQEREKMLIAV